MLQIKEENTEIRGLSTRQTIVYLLGFILIFAFFLFTSAPGVTFEDSGELMSAAVTLGNAHPPGYPLYSLFGHLFAKLPTGNSAWNINLMSAFFSTLALALFFILFSIVSGSRAIAGTVVLLLAVSQSFWNVSTIAEVYSMNLFFVALISLLGFIYSREASMPPRGLWVMGFLTGFAAANSQMVVLIIPGIAIALLFSGKRKSIHVKDLLIAGGFGLFGLLVYLYLPIRAAASPYINWGNPENWANFSDVLFRKQYGGIGLGDQGLLFYFRQFIIVSPLYELFGLRDLTDGGSPILQVPFFILCWAVVVYGFRKEKNKAFKGMSLSHAFFFSLFIILIAMTPKEKEFALKVFFLPFWAFFFYYMVIGLITFLEKFVKDKKKRLILPLSLVIAVFIINFPSNNMHEYFYSIDYAQNVLASAPEKAIIITKKDNETFNLWEQQCCEKRRTDLWIINYVTLSESWYIRHLSKIYPGFITHVQPIGQWTKEQIRNAVLADIIKQFGQEKTILFSDQEIPLQNEGKMLTPFGCAYKVSAIGEKPDLKESFRLMRFRGLEKAKRFDVMTLLMIQNISFIAEETGRAFYDKDDMEKALEFFERTIHLNELIGFEPNNFMSCQMIGMVKMKQGDNESALKYFERAVLAQPKSQAGQELARQIAGMRSPILSKEVIAAEEQYNNGNYNGALGYYREELARAPTAKIFANMGDCYFNMNRFSDAVRFYEKALSLDKTYINAYYNLGGSYLMLNQVEKAGVVWRAGLAIQPGNTSLREAITKYIK